MHPSHELSNGMANLLSGDKSQLRKLRNKAEFKFTHVLLCLSTAAFETWLAYEYFTGFIDVEGWVLAHVVGVLGVLAAILVVRRKQQDVVLLSMLFTSMLLTGPFGAIGTAALSLFLLTLRFSPERLNAWYDRISGSAPSDLVSDMYEAITSGRQSVDGLPSSRTFIDVLQNGSLHQQQTVLGLISRNFNDDFLPILTQALKSPNATIRVQAAAIANRLSRKYRDKIWSPVN